LPGRQNPLQAKSRPAPIKTVLVGSLAAQEREHIRRAMAAYGTSLKGKRQAAKALGISLATLYKRIKTLDVPSG
jgi:transcriptional regulator with PAS, ATPase and Fis domain